ncbi:MAG: FtsK/SpoIIIE domain-containing protein [Deltaproteobacteria bacterium]
MSVELSVADVRQALLRSAPSDVIGSGEAATLLLGRLFHEVFADLVSADPRRSGLRVIVEAGNPPEQCLAKLLEHSWQRLVAPRLRRHAASLQTSSCEVLVLWRALNRLCEWLVNVVSELAEQSAQPRGSWQPLAELLRSEVPLTCEIEEAGWLEPVRLVGIADSILHVPGTSHYCAIELKLGRCAPLIDLGQAALYHLILKRSSGQLSRSALALMRFSPELEEHVVDAAALAVVEPRLLDLLAELAGVAQQADPEVVHVMEEDTRQPSPDPERYAELGKRLVRAYREQGMGIEIRQAPLVGPRFLRFSVRLASGMRVAGLRRCTAEVRHRLELRTEPLINQEAGHLYVDVERPDPRDILFSIVQSQLPPAEPLCGSAKIPVGVDAAGQLQLTDLGSSGRSHVLAAGTTGSGKTEWLRMMMAGLIVANTPESLRFVTLDPKLTAFAELERSKFLWNERSWWVPGAERQPSELFQDLIEEMERRYQLTRDSGTDNLRDHVLATRRPLPRIVCICDEYYALISQSREEKRQIEDAVALLGAKARAAGIHLVLATQQPSRAVISGIIQANLPCRVALTLQSHIESNMILGARGAERLTGQGDLLYKDFGDPVRLQAPFLSAAERASLFRG